MWGNPAEPGDDLVRSGRPVQGEELQAGRPAREQAVAELGDPLEPHLAEGLGVPRGGAQLSHQRPNAGLGHLGAVLLEKVAAGRLPEAFTASVHAGDEAALPAIAAALENMEPQARGLAVLEVRDAAEELPLNPPAGVEVVWLHRAGDFTPETTRLADYLRAAELPDAAENDIQVFIHGEREQMKLIRRALVEERGLPRKGMSLSAYWAYGRVEDEFQAEKKTPVGQIDPA